MKNIIFISIILLLPVACKNNSSSNEENYKLLQEHYSRGDSLYKTGLYTESFEELFMAEELAIKIRDNEYYGLIQHYWTKFPERTVLEEKKKEELRLMSMKYEYMAKNKRKDMYLLFFISIACVSLILYCYLQNREKNRRSINESNNKIKIIQQKIEENEANAVKEIEDIKKRLFKERFYTIDKLCDELYQSNEKDRDKESKSINKIINNFKNDKGIAQLEDTINLYKNNILSKLRKQIPTLNEQEIIFAIYAYAGLSNNTISYLIGKPIETIYGKRSKLKRKIKASGAKDADWFVEELK